MNPTLTPNRVFGRPAALTALATFVLAAAPASAAAKGGFEPLPDSGVVAAGTIVCVAKEACAVRPAPRQIAARVAGKRVKARVVVPAFLGAGGKTTVKLRFGSGAMERLAGHSAAFRGAVLVSGSGRRTSEAFLVRLKRAAPSPVAPSPTAPGTTGVGGNSGPNGEPPHSEAIAGEAPPLARPLTAKTVEAVSLTWYPRDSWLRYVSSGTSSGDGVGTSGGATGTDSTASPCSDQGSDSDADLPYTIQFAAAESWFDPASGTAAIDGTGSVSFRYRAHTINLTASDPEFQFNGASSLAVFRMSGSEGTPYPNQRVGLLSLDTTGQPTTSTVGGKTTYAYDLVRGRLTPDGEKVFAGFYTAPSNNQFGCVSASFTTP